jgi:hypothetical protein
MNNTTNTTTPNNYPSPPVDINAILLMIFYHYFPSLQIAIAASVLFAVITCILVMQTIKYGGWKFMTYGIIGSVAEILGYTLRAVCSQQASLSVFIVTTFLLLIAPISLALVNYIVVSILLENSSKKLVRVFC